MSTLRLGRVVRELVATFGLVFFSVGVICTAHLPAPTAGGTLLAWRPGPLGIALAQGLTFLVFLRLTLPGGGGGLNPALTLGWWVFHRLDGRQALGLLLGQVLGAWLAVGCLREVFPLPVLRSARWGAPHLALAWNDTQSFWQGLLCGSGVELLLTFFLAWIIFDALPAPATELAQHAAAERASLLAGALAVVAALLAGPLIGAGAGNPVHWLGAVLWEAGDAGNGRCWNDALVYLAGPALGALLAAVWCWRWTPHRNESCAL